MDGGDGRMPVMVARGYTLLYGGEITLAHLEQFFVSVLRVSIPPDELMPLDDILKAYGPSAAREPAAVIIDAKGEVVAGMLAEVYPRSRALLVSYLAARPDVRGHGLGSVLIQECLPLWRERIAPSVVLLEIDDPRQHAADEWYGDPQARVRFYDRLGAVVLPLSYFQPALDADSQRVGGMLLISMLDGNESSVDAAVITAFLEEYFTACEGAGAVSDDGVRGLLNSVLERSAGGRLPASPLRDFAAAVPDDGRQP